MSTVAIVMGSSSDWPVVGKAADTLAALGIPYRVRVLSAHRTPDQAADFAKGAREAGFRVLIAAAGKAAHLPGVLAAHTTLPVVGLPIASPFLDGLDALLSMAQMPGGVPVATVGVNAAENAALLAAQMLALSDPAVEERLAAYRRAQTEKVLAADREFDKGE